MQTPMQTALTVDDRSGVGEARRLAARLASQLHFSESAAGALALVVTEAATNIVKHAERGELIFRALQRDSVSGVELLAIDRGPGFQNPGHAMRDGHSTAGSPGTGLGAMQRMSSEFDVHSVAGKGSALRLVIWAGPAAHATEDLEVGAVCLPKAGEITSGDAWTVIPSPRGHFVCATDGLGHGPYAAAAARAAIAAFTEAAARGASAEQIVQAAHLALRSTRGAAIAVALLHANAALCTFCGVGNIAGCLITHALSRSMVSYNGIVGHQVRKIREYQYPMTRDSLCILHSDGLATRWRLDDYPGLEGSHPGLVAAVLYRDYSRGRDDTAVIAARHRRRGAHP